MVGVRSLGNKKRYTLQTVQVVANGDPVLVGVQKFEQRDETVRRQKYCRKKDECVVIDYEIKDGQMVEKSRRVSLCRD